MISLLMHIHMYMGSPDLTEFIYKQNKNQWLTSIEDKVYINFPNQNLIKYHIDDT